MKKPNLWLVQSRDFLGFCGICSSLRPGKIVHNHSHKQTGEEEADICTLRSTMTETKKTCMQDQ